MNEQEKAYEATLREVGDRPQTQEAMSLLTPDLLKCSRQLRWQMNTLTTDGNSVIDATGKLWSLETTHPMPLPDGIRDSSMMVYYDANNKRWECAKYHDSTHWLLRTEPPAPKKP